MMRKTFHSILILFSLMPLGCIEPYTIEGSTEDPRFLVVDGFIDASAKTCAVRLSRAVALNAEHSPEGETGASVSIESEDGTMFNLYEVVGDPAKTEAGLYLAEEVPVSADKHYQLHITLSNGRQYESDPVRIERAAKIESLEWTPEAEAVRIRVSTVPNTNSTQFYRWRFTESWQYNAPRSSNFVIRDGVPQSREPNQRIYTCYRQDPSSRILLGSSQNLSIEVMRNYIVQSLPTTSVKISSKYHLRLQQYALSEEAYTFWLNLYKTTEATGGLFDPMPGQVIGNLRSVSDPSEIVVGYFSGSTVEETSLWIDRSDFPAGYVQYRAPFCQVDTLELDQMVGLLEGTPLVDAVYGFGGAITGYLISSRSCLDCRVYGGGETTKPDFWP